MRSCFGRNNSERISLLKGKSQKTRLQKSRDNICIDFCRVDGATVSKLLAEKWKKLDSEEQQKFFSEAEKLKNLHQLQHPNYKFNPKTKRIGMKKSVARLEPLTRVTAITESGGAAAAQEFTVNLPDSSEDIAIHNLSNDQNIIIQPVNLDSPPPTTSQPLPQIIPIPEADQTITTSVVELE